MTTTWIYTILSVIIVSLISLVGIFTLSFNKTKLYQMLIYFVSLSVGTLMGDAFIHLIPEAFKETKNPNLISLYLLSGVFLFFILEKVIHWRHCHKEPCEDHPHPFSYIILVGDSVHNFVDGLVIGASYLVSVPVGIATTIAVVFHEIPHEIGNFGSLVYGGFSTGRALLFNFITALTAILGAIAVLLLSLDSKHLTEFLIPFAAGGFIYIASADLIPEMHKEVEIKKTLGQLAALFLGIGLMVGLVVLG